MQDNRRVLFGADAIANLAVATNLHRVQVEHELRTVLLKLRNAYLRAPGDTQELTPVLRKSFSSVLTLLRHVIIAFGEEPPATSRDIIGRATALTQSNSAIFERVLSLRNHVDSQVEIAADLWSVFGGAGKSDSRVGQAFAQSRMAAHPEGAFLNLSKTRSI